MRRPKSVQMRVGEFYTVQGAAEALSLSYWTVYRYVRIAGIPTTWLGNQMLVRLEDLHELFQYPQVGSSQEQDMV